MPSCKELLTQLRNVSIENDEFYRSQNFSEDLLERFWLCTIANTILFLMKEDSIEEFIRCEREEHEIYSSSPDDFHSTMIRTVRVWVLQQIGGDQLVKMLDAADQFL